MVNIMEEVKYNELDSLTEFNYPIIKIEETEYCKLHIQYEADPEVVSEKINTAVASLKKVNVPGFRPGKAPVNAIKMKFKKQIDNFVVNEMVNSVIDDIIFESGSKPALEPNFSNIKIDGNKFSCSVEFYKKPDFQVENIKFDIPKPVLPYDEEILIERSLQDLRMRTGELEPYGDDDEVELGDQVTFSFSATVDGQVFDGLTSEGELYTVGQNKWKNFDNYIIGMKADETREFDFVFENVSPELNEKTAHFTVTVHMGTKRKPHPIDEEFFTTLGVKDIDELKSKLRTITLSQIKRQENDLIQKQVAIKLIEANPFEVPDFLLKQIFFQTALGFGYLPDQIENNLLDKEDYNTIMTSALNNIKLSLILDVVRENEPDAILNNSEITQRLASHPSLQGHDINKLLSNPQTAPQIQQFISSIKEEFTMQWLISQSNIIS